MKGKYKKYYLLVGVIISYSFIFLFNSYLFRTTPGLTAPTLIFWGFFGANIVATVFFLRNSKSRIKVKKEMQRYWKLVGGVSVLTFGGIVLWFFAVSQLGSGITSLLEKSNIFFMFLLGVLFLKEKVFSREIMYALIAVAGIFLITNIKEEVTPLGVGAILSSELLYSLHGFLVKKFGKNIQVLQFVYLRSLTVFAIVGIFFGVLGKIDIVELRVIILGSISLLMGAFVSKYFYFEALKYFPISKIGIFLLLESILTIFGAYLFFGDPVTLQKVMGVFLILGGAWLFLREQEKVKK